jgi:hypothetical protein
MNGDTALKGFALLIFAALFIFGMVFLLGYNRAPTVYPRTMSHHVSNPVVTPTYLNPYGHLDYWLDSPAIDSDLQAILKYLLFRGVYVDTGEPFSDDVLDALKYASRWTQSSSSPPIWYYHSFDGQHHYMLVWSMEYGVWTIKPI